jgi:formylglycine-generating enzyme required for sulfatase activity
MTEYFVEDLGNGVTLDLVYIPAGRFMMGYRDLVNVPAFYLGKYPITQAQYREIVGSNPSHFQGSQRPVESVSWYDAQAFCQKLGKLKNKPYSLPTEAQWEYACRDNTTNNPSHSSEYISADDMNCNGKDSPDVYGYGYTGRTYLATTTDVGFFPANSFGLYDLRGNVWEWCLDTYYRAAPTDGSDWIDEHHYRVLRGGSWNDSPENCSSTSRSSYAPDVRGYGIGFRVALPPSPGLP